MYPHMNLRLINMCMHIQLFICVLLFYVVEELEQQVEEAKSIMKLNIEQVLDRSERLDTLEEKATDLSSAAAMFRKKSNKLVNSMS